MTKSLIVGCGDVGTRIAKLLSGQNKAIVATESSLLKLSDITQVDACQINLDSAVSFTDDLLACEHIYYLVPPQKSGHKDNRSKHFLAALKAGVDSLNSSIEANTKRIVLISTTGVYGDHDGEWIDETTPANPQTDRAKRRWDMEQQWAQYAKDSGSVISTLRVPGIYSHSRLPRERIEKLVSIVDPSECGFTNRVHADDLAAICVKVMNQQTSSDVYNATDGSPGKISEYLLAVADVLNLPTPPIIPMSEAQAQVSAGMLSYLNESRKISNAKLLKTFNIKLNYPDFKVGIQH